VIAALLAAAAATPAVEPLDALAWEPIGARATAEGEVALRRAALDGVPCVEGAARVAATPEALLALTDDMASAPAWSAATLAISEELARDEAGFVLFQHFDAPAWTLTADRYWIVRGEPELVDGRTARYRWRRVPAAAHPDALARALALHERAVELPVNLGEWRFTEAPGGADLRYRACADLGGRLPDAVQAWVSTRQIPDLIAELVAEARRRAGR
jgi:hypothetical protein